MTIEGRDDQETEPDIGEHIRGPRTPDELRAEIEVFVDGFLPSDDEIEAARDAKAIHDPIWGTSVYSPVEVSIIDTPLMQRLRGVHQTSLAYLIYPAANHTRFEHSLGVTVVADRLCDALVSDVEVRSEYSGAVEVEQHTADRLAVRLAALLHDCGHSFLSHIGESQLKGHPALVELQAGPQYEKAKEHEILSALIVRSERFGRFFDRVKNLYPRDGRLDHVNLDEIAGFIVGHATPKRQFLADIINGAFDADKLDYLYRDAYFTGLRLALDIDRLLYAMTVAVVDRTWLETGEREDEGSRRKSLDELADDCRLRLVVRASGVTALEQILFNKIQLTVGIYHHQKVRAADSMLSSFMERIVEMGGNGVNISIDNPIDFITYTDWEWLYTQAEKDEYLGSITSRIKKRSLPKRALVISKATVVDGLTRYTRFQEDDDWDEVHGELRQMVLDKLPQDHGLKPYDIVFDLPFQPSFREASQTPVRLSNGGIDTLENFFPTGHWLTTFFTAKWEGHVFCPGGAALRSQVAAAAKFALENHPDISLKLKDEAVTLAHLNPVGLPDFATAAGQASLS